MLPVIKWAGGKRQLLNELKDGMPATYGKYVEPFVGSGALYFDISPSSAKLNDFNPELVNMYLSIRDATEELIAYLDKYQMEHNSLSSIDEKKTYYYERRKEFNVALKEGNSLMVRDAALLMYLNKACFNGLYRVNRNGLFNVPFGQRKIVNLYDESNLRSCAKSLKSTVITCGDFEAACDDLVAGDFCYFDSPYYDTFDTYQSGGFPEADHVRLANLFRRLSQKGVYCMLSNSDTDYIKNLYRDFDITIVPVKRMINRDAKNRTSTEVIIRNYSKR